MKKSIGTIIIILLSCLQMNAQSDLKANPKDLDNIKNCMIGFMTAMNKWELKCFADGNKLEALAKDKSLSDKKYYETRDKMLDEHNSSYFAIFHKYAIPNIKENMGSYGDPPRYDPALEKIDSIEMPTSETAIVYTSKIQWGEMLPRKYFLRKQNNEWLLYDKLFWIERTQEWIESGGL